MEITREQAAMLYGGSWSSMMQRSPSSTFTQCDRFVWEAPNGRGATGGMSHLWGYRGADCMFYTACPAHELPQDRTE